MFICYDSKMSYTVSSDEVIRLFFVKISLITPLRIVQIVCFSTQSGIMNHFMFYRDCTFIRNTLANKLNKNDSDIKRGTSESNVSCSISS